MTPDERKADIARQNKARKERYLKKNPMKRVTQKLSDMTAAEKKLHIQAQAKQRHERHKLKKKSESPSKRVKKERVTRTDEERKEHERALAKERKRRFKNKSKKENNGGENGEEKIELDGGTEADGGGGLGALQASGHHIPEGAGDIDVDLFGHMVPSENKFRAGAKAKAKSKQKAKAKAKAKSKMGVKRN